MNLRLHATLWLGLAVAACDKPEQSQSPAGETAEAPRITKTQRPPRVDAPDARAKLRSELSDAGQTESPEKRNQAVAKVAWNALELDPELAREAMDQLPPDSAERTRLIQHMAMRMAEENVDHALIWAASLGTEHENAAAIGHIALVLADTDPERAGNLLSESGIEGRDFDVVVVQVLGRWAEQSPADAAEWVALFPAGKSRVAGIKSVISAWAEADAKAALTWMSTLQDEAVHKETLQAISAELLTQPEAVRQEWLSHADPSTREELEARLEGEKKETGIKSLPPFE